MLQGSVTCANSTDWEGLIGSLRSGGWMDGDFFTDEDGDHLTQEPNAHHDTRTLEIPLSVYYNPPSRTFVFGHPGRTGRVVGTCSDRCFIGWVDCPESCDEESLSPYARYAMPYPEDGMRDFEDFEDFEDSADMREWCEDAEAEFHARHDLTR